MFDLRQMTEKFSLEDLKAHGSDIFALQEALLSHIEALSVELEAAKSKAEALSKDYEENLKEKEAAAREKEELLNEQLILLSNQLTSLKQVLIHSHASNHVSKRVLLAILGSEDSIKSLL